MDDSERFLELRSLLLQPPSYRLWQQLLLCLDAWPVEERQPAIEYASGHLAHWPDAMRMVGWHEIEAYDELDPAVHPVSLARRLDIFTDPYGARAFLDALGQQRLPLSQLTELRFAGCEFQLEELERLLAPGYFASLQMLDLGDTELLQDALAFLCEVDGLEGLHTLSLEGGNIELHTMERLLGSRLMAGLRRLDLSQSLGMRELEAFAYSDVVGGIEALALKFCGFAGAGLEVVAQSNLASLQMLDYTGNSCSLAHMQAFVDNVKLGALEAINFQLCQLSDGAFATLVESPFAAQLRALDLGHNQIGEPGAMALAESDVARGLVHLDLMFNSIGSEGLEALVTSENLKHIERLKLGRNESTEDVVELLATSPHLQSLRQLEYSRNHVLPEHLELLCGRNVPYQLERLDLAFNPINSHGVEVLAASTSLQGLTHLWLEGSGMDDDAIRALCRSSQLPSLSHLCCVFNDISLEGLASIADALRNGGLPSLMHLNLGKDEGELPMFGEDERKMLLEARPGMSLILSDDDGYPTDEEGRDLWEMPINCVPMAKWCNREV